MVRIGHADLRVRAVAGLARELEGDDARDVALQGQHLQVEHQPGVIGVGGRHADGAIEVRQRSVAATSLRPSGCAAPPRGPSSRYWPTRALIAGAERVLQTGDLLGHGIEQAGPASAARRGDRPWRRPRRTAARIPAADALRPAAASSATTTRDCSDTRRRNRCRTGRRSRGGPSTARATAAASPGRSAERRSGRPSCPDSSRRSRCAAPWRR